MHPVKHQIPDIGAATNRLKERYCQRLKRKPKRHRPTILSQIESPKRHRPTTLPQIVDIA